MNNIFLKKNIFSTEILQILLILFLLYVFDEL